ncbi:MAG: site-2 protease family protein, partial [Nitrososphaeria archaeon]
SVEKHFPIIMLKTSRFLGVIEWFSKLKGVGVLSSFFLYILPAVAGFMTYMLASALVNMLKNFLLRSYVRSLGLEANLLLPGLNPYLPFVYGWVGVVVAIAVHEGAHGVVARSKGLPVKSAGLLFFLIVPVGAFVEVDESEMVQAPPSKSMKVLAAGPGANLAVAAVALTLLLLLLSTVSPAYGNLLLYAVVENGPAYNAGVKHGEVILSVNGVNVSSLSEVEKILSSLRVNDILTLTAYVPGNRSIVEHHIVLGSRPDNVSRAYMGVTIVSLDAVLNNYRRFGLENVLSYLVWPTLSPSTIPFSEHLAPYYVSSAVGSLYPFVANLFYWTWMVNFNLSLFNALPIYPLDGGQALKIFLKKVSGKRVSERGQNIIVGVISALMMFLVISTVLVPYIF